MSAYHFFTFDLGATSGRAILASLRNNKIEFTELLRFPNQIQTIEGKYYWDIDHLFQQLKQALRLVAEKGITLDGIGIDTWGVDFVYVDEDGALLGWPRSYRDPYTQGVPEAFFKVIDRQQVYQVTGIQTMNFNTLFQLYAAQHEPDTVIKQAKKILFIPDALIYLLTGKMVCEYTIASTSQLLNAKTRQFAPQLLDALQINADMLSPVVMPGTVIGTVSETITKECGIAPTQVIAVGGHDTASAIAAIPAKNAHYAYLSSGTWSLMGIVVDEPILTTTAYELNFTNEGAVDGSIRFLKNIAGMWILEQCLQEWRSQNIHYTYPELVKLSETATPFARHIDPDAACFADPSCCTQTIVQFCKDSGQSIPETHADFVRCIFESLAFKYRYVLECLQQMAPFPIEELHIIGGGSQNAVLNQFTANLINMPVLAGPAEATAMGNVLMQAKGVGALQSTAEMCTCLQNSVQQTVYLPCEVALWNHEYKKIMNYEL